MEESEVDNYLERAMSGLELPRGKTLKQTKVTVN